MGYFKSAITGFSWMSGFRVISRGVALVRTAILARILLPAQFGIYGIALIVLAFLENLTETGINVFLIQERRDVEGYVDTAWVVSIIRGIIISVGILLSTPLIASFFDAPDAKSLLYLASLIPFIRGFINPLRVKFQKDLAFGKEFWFRFSVFSFDSAVAILLTLILRSPIGLVWGLIAGSMLEVVISFVFISPRPKFTFVFPRAKRIIKRGKWITMASIFDYLSKQGDDAVVGRILNTTALGIYQMGYRISTIPVTEISDVLGKVTFPVYVRIAGNTKRLKRAYIRTVLSISAVALPIGIVIYIFPRELVSLILGNNWLGVVPILRVLAIFGVLQSITGSVGALFLGVGKQEYITNITLVKFLGLAITIVPLILNFGILGAAYSSIISVIVSIPLILYYLRKVF